MRVLHVIPSVSAAHGGPSVALRLMVDGLRAANVHVDVATTGEGHPEEGKRGREEDRVGYHFFPRQSRFYTVSWPLWSWLMREARAYDLLHVHAVFSFASTAAARAAARARVPYLIRPLGTLAPYGMRQRRLLKALSFRLVERRTLARAAALHCTSEMESDEIRALGVATRTAVIPLGIDVDPFTRARPGNWLAQRAPHLAHRRILLFLSRIDPKKGLELVLDALAELRAGNAPQLALVVAGTGEPAYLRTLHQRAQRLAINESVLWAGHLEGAEKLQALAAAYAFVLPSWAENFGLAAVEALAAGVPVVITRHVGIQADVAAAQAGIIIERKASALTQALRGLLDQPELRAEMATNARRLAHDRFAQPIMTQRLLELYRSVLV